ncbi:Carbamoyl-phosphate synthase small chain [Morganella morganii]|nr:Carbamoyl-phosphate synthase small chain [Morganella morganii]
MISLHSASRVTLKPAPGPHDAAPLFDHFIELMKNARH